MIENEEQFRSRYWIDKELWNLIESLRTVARAARYFLNGNWDFKEGSDAYDRHEQLIDALDALPQWVLEE